MKLSRGIENLLVFVLRLYQGTISPFLGPCCRFHPTCSRYTVQAIHIHGPMKGLWLGLRRLCRCHPFHPGGVDPVPVPGSERIQR